MLQHRRIELGSSSLPQGALTLFLLELILTHKYRGHQLPDRWLNRDIELSGLGAGKRAEGNRSRNEASIHPLIPILS